MNCEEIAPPTTYHFRARPCSKKHGVKRTRWAPSPLTTKIRALCAHHRAVVDRHGDIKTARDQ